MRPINARDLMNPDPLTVRETMSIGELATFLTENEISGAPVVDRKGRLVGVVSVVDLARADSEKSEDTSWSSVHADSYADDWDRRALGDGVKIFHLEPDALQVRDIMNSSVHSVDPEATVPEIARRMLHYHLHRLLVIEDDQLIGVLSTSDLLGLLLEEE